MKITRAEDYAVTLVTALAERYDRGYTSLTVISRNRHLPPLFLKHIVRALKTAGLVDVKNGRNGGYRLAKPPQHISVGAVLAAFSPKPLASACMRDEHVASCPFYAGCSSRRTWETINRRFSRQLNALSFAEIIKTR